MTKANRAEQLYERALSAMKKDLWLKAIKLFKNDLALVQKDWRLSWNLGWCYFKLNRLEDARKHMIQAARLAPENPTCKWGLGTVYLERKHYKKAEAVLAEALKIKESSLTRVALALAYLSQGKLSEAENVHLEGIRLKPRQSARYESYAAFLSDVGREREAHKMNRKAEQLRSVN
jgi:Flp pilus assembly protein TadD